MENRKGDRCSQLCAKLRHLPPLIFCFLFSHFRLRVLRRRLRFSRRTARAQAARPDGRHRPRRRADTATTWSSRFTLPKETVDHRPLKQPPAIEIYRDFAPYPPPSGARSRNASPALPRSHAARHHSFRHGDNYTTTATFATSIRSSRKISRSIRTASRIYIGAHARFAKKDLGRFERRDAAHLSARRSDRRLESGSHSLGRRCSRWTPPQKDSGRLRAAHRVLSHLSRRNASRRRDPARLNRAERKLRS